MEVTIGTHIVAEFYGCPAEKLKTVAPVKKIVEACVRESKLTKLRSEYHQFKPFGVTGFVLLSESHVAVHTWPEKDYLALDIFCCSSKEKAEKAYSYLLKHFKPKKVFEKDFDRGINKKPF